MPMKNILLLLSLILITRIAVSQDTHYSQFYYSPLTLNPALTGNFEGTWRVGANYRSQWGSISAPSVYSTPSVFADFKLGSSYFKYNSFGLGILLLTDKAGDGQLTTTTAMISGAYHQSLDQVGNYHLSFGGMWGWTQKGIDLSRLDFFDEFRGTDFSGTTVDPIANTSFAYTDIMGGIAFNALLSEYSRFTLGANIAHVTRPNESFYASPLNTNEIGTRYVVHTSATIGVNNKVYIFPSALYQLQSSSQELVVGTNVGMNFSPSRYKVGTIVYIGTLTRLNDAIIPTIGFIAKGLKAGVSYDINTSGLDVATGGQGGFEIGIVYTDGKTQKKGKRMFCPRF